MENVIFQKAGKGPGGWKKLGNGLLIGALAVFVLVTALSCFYTVDDKQQAVVTTFGKVTGITDAGFHFKLPFGIQQVEKVNVNVYQHLELGYRSSNNETVTDEASMITGDYNIVNVDFFIEYKISDPVRYLYASSDPTEILRNLIQSQVRNVVGSSAVDSVLTDGKVFINWRFCFLYRLKFTTAHLHSPPDAHILIVSLYTLYSHMKRFFSKKGNKKRGSPLFFYEVQN